MGWSIALIQNTVVVPEEERMAVAKKLIKVTDKFWDFKSEIDFDEEVPGLEALAAVFDNGKLVFDGDDMEHMDYVTGNDEACAALAAAGATGRLTFGSLEGDNRGTFWGVEFASGHYRRLRATTADINWNIGTSIPA